MSNDAKLLRKQLRNVVQELLPSLLTKELEEALFKRIEGRLDSLNDHVKKTLHEMNERQKDTLGFLVRQSVVSDKDKST